MLRKVLFGTALLAGLFAMAPNAAEAKDPPLPQGYYYPYVYFPHNYWPQYSPQWPEPKGAPYMRPPAYMAYPAFKEPNWHYMLWMPQKYYRGNHFFLDQF
jgi:hypothetical protein